VANSACKQTIDRAVMQWMQYRLNRKMPGLVMPDIDEILKGSRMIETNIDQWRAKAIAEGVLLGHQEGRQEGTTSLLERQIGKRFGPVSDDIRTRLKSAADEQLEIWGERILEAQSLAQVFNEH
jgi:flagellar biosynthesis/type III secretory pathway protein FliH